MIHKTLSLISLLSLAALLEGCSQDKKPKSPGSPQEAINKSDEDLDDSEDATEKTNKDAKVPPKGELDGDTPMNPQEMGPSDIISCSDKPKGRTYKGFGDSNLTAGREDKVPLLGNRYRIKPFEALSADITRVFGTAPASLARAAATFPTAGVRWYVEPIASGVTLFATYRVAYDGGLTIAGSDPLLQVAPSDESAQKACEKYMELAWQRPGTAEEIGHCKSVALMATASETDNKVRWAHTIASILTATDFVSY